MAYPGPWFGGHHAGGIKLITHKGNRRFQARIAIRRDGVRVQLAYRTFYVADYRDVDEARYDAEMWLTNESISLSCTKNLCRYLNETLIEMQLTREKTTTFDADVLERLSSHIWCAVDTNGSQYALSNVPNSASLRMHRIVSENRWPVVDHVDQNGLNNQRSNLRDGTNSVNQLNFRIQKGSKTGIKGVRVRKCTNGKTKVTAAIRFKGVCTTRSATVTTEEMDMALEDASKWVKKRRSELLHDTDTVKKQKTSVK